MRVIGADLWDSTSSLSPAMPASVAFAASVPWEFAGRGQQPAGSGGCAAAPMPTTPSIMLVNQNLFESTSVSSRPRWLSRTGLSRRRYMPASGPSGCSSYIDSSSLLASVNVSSRTNSPARSGAMLA
eukprot:CAMPEP_0182574792 /NCGR_PEP_ID=MMETSP1324-20130603/27384_1 /TAXON_ID=236786 /ORGANISM="Florenciella sp., Strain RCC1587" /LENGTH=126 /DNA_ID=CAMNT_0024790261 /DNA_START=95 /DNA_END=476 /DNA_ORIENTATION=-